MILIIGKYLTRPVLLGGEELPDDRPELRAEVVAVEPPLEQRVRAAVLHVVAEPVRFGAEAVALNDQADSLGAALRGVGDLARKQEDLKGKSCG